MEPTRQASAKARGSFVTLGRRVLNRGSRVFSEGGPMFSEHNSPVYVLGHSEIELDHLISQSRFYGELTEEVLCRAGIGAGMRVVDVGCGARDVSLLLASLVGPTGSVLGVDRAAESMQVAQARVAGAQLTPVTFRHCDLADLLLDTSVDAGGGRFVLLYLADPASTH